MTNEEISIYRSNSIRLWMPQLFTMMEQFKNDYSKYEYSSSQPRFCYMLGQQGANHTFSTSFVNETLNAAHTCVPVLRYLHTNTINHSLFTHISLFFTLRWCKLRLHNVYRCLLRVLTKDLLILPFSFCLYTLKISIIFFFTRVLFQVELNSKVFINSIVIAVTGVIGYTLAGTLITVVGKKKLIGEISTLDINFV